VPLASREFRSGENGLEYQRTYCTDAAFLAAIDRLQQRADRTHDNYPMERRLGYILTTGGNWRSPIGDFRMVVDKGSPLFKDLGGMHNVHVNKTGEAALKKGGPYPNGTMFVTDLHDFSIADGSYVMGDLKGVAVMAKDAKKYASTGGWGFGRFIDGKPVDAAQHETCFACHAARVKDRDYVFTRRAP